MGPIFKSKILHPLSHLLGGNNHRVAKDHDRDQIFGLDC